MKIELLNGFTRVNPKDTANVYNLEGRHRSRKMKKRRLMRSLSPENRERMQMRAQRMQARKKQMPLTSIASDKASRRARMEERARVGNKRMNPQQMLRGYDVNYNLKDNAIYSDTELLQFPGAGLLARRLMKGKKSKGIPRVAKRGAVNPITGQTIEQQVPLRGQAKRQARRDKRRADREAKKSTRKQARRDVRRQKRTDRQEARRMRQEQRQQNRLARTQARQDRKLAQTEARQQDNIIKAQAKAGATESGQTFGQKVGDFFGNVGEGAQNLLANNPGLRAGVFENIEDVTGIDPNEFIDTKSGEEVTEDQSFFDKYKIPILIGGLGIGAFLLTRKKK
tara:strand:- start:87 stop:1103 length:1017 start_codon:yes stop_codon:yes gene_type:complete